MLDIKVVIDASAWLKVILQEEGYQSTAGLIQSSEWYAPEWILIEAANAITKKSIYTPKEKSEYIRLIQADPFKRIPPEIWFNEAARLAIKYGKLSFYDAAYIAGAKELNASILSEDPEILSVIAKENIEKFME